MEILRTIRLYGKLGSRFGRVHRLAVQNTAEAVRALCALLPGFEQELMMSHTRGIRYACFLGGRNISKEDLALSGGSDDIRIAPVIAGAKRGGVLQTIVGITLIVAGFVFQVPQLITAGITMTIGGVIQMLSPQQTLQAGDSKDNGASYNFSGAVNTTAQGNPVPVLYGRMIVGSAVISAGIVAQDQAYVGAPLASPPIPHVLGLFEDL